MDEQAQVILAVPSVVPSSSELSKPTEPFRVQLLSSRATLPTKGSPGAAGYDLCSARNCTVLAGGRYLVPTDLAMAVPSGTYGRIAPRSGLATTRGIHVGAGVIDADYRGHVQICLFNLGSMDLLIREGDRIAQLILERYADQAQLVQVCGNNTLQTNTRLDAHERWEYDETTDTQKLMRLVALCKDCHQSTHMGLAGVMGQTEKAMKHLQKVRQCTWAEVVEHKAMAGAVWRQRNRKTWNLDLSLLIRNGISIVTPVDKTERIQLSNEGLICAYRKDMDEAQMDAQRKRQLVYIQPSQPQGTRSDVNASLPFTTTTTTTTTATTLVSMQDESIPTQTPKHPTKQTTKQTTKQKPKRKRVSVKEE